MTATQTPARLKIRYAEEILPALVERFAGVQLVIAHAGIADMAGLPHGVIGDPRALITARQFHELAALGRSLFPEDPAFSLNIADLSKISGGQAQVTGTGSGTGAMVNSATMASTPWTSCAGA